MILIPIVTLKPYQGIYWPCFLLHQDRFQYHKVLQQVVMIVLLPNKEIYKEIHVFVMVIIMIIIVLTNVNYAILDAITVQRN